MNILTEAELLARLNNVPGVHLTRETFKQSLRRLFIERGEARQLGTGQRSDWAYDARDLWQWEAYLAKRAEFIRLGQWSSKRPYSLDELDQAAGEYDGDEPPAATE